MGELKEKTNAELYVMKGECEDEYESVKAKGKEIIERLDAIAAKYKEIKNEMKRRGF